MSLENTRDIGTAKIVMVGGGSGGSGVSDVAWDGTNKKLQQTKNGTTSDIVTGATILDGLTSSQVTNALGYTPPQQDTNTHRPIKMNGTQILGDNTTALDLVAGTNVTLSNNGGAVTINASGGSGDTISKTRYSVSSWSSSANSDGYYTNTITLDPPIDTAPNIYIAGASFGVAPTSTQETMFSYVKLCKVYGSTLTLYATTRPTSKFYICVEGVEGTGTITDVYGNVIQPNGGAEYFQYTVTVNPEDYNAWGVLYNVNKVITLSKSRANKKVFATILCDANDYYGIPSISERDSDTELLLHFVRPTVPNQSATYTINVMYV